MSRPDNRRAPSARRPGNGQRGMSAAVELTVLVPVMVMMLGMIVAGGRLWFARSAVVDAAQASARAATLARNPAAARVAAKQVGLANLDGHDLHCLSAVVSVDVNAFGVPVGQPATVTAEVTCRVGFADVFLPGLPGSIVLQANGSSALDTYRGRR